MRRRAILDLAQYSDVHFFNEVSEGMLLIHENALRLYEGVRTLVNSQNFRGARALETIAKEEASKYLILIDAIRCPRKNNDKQFRNQLLKFNKHLAKGIYAESADWKPANFKEVKEGVYQLCEDYYLDGPNDVDWIFENWIIWQREESFYVDYIEYDEEHRWVTPRSYEDISSAFFFRTAPKVIRLVDALHHVGFSEPKALAIVSNLWRPFIIYDETSWKEVEKHNIKTLQKLEDEAVLENIENIYYNTVVQEWCFPMYTLPMIMSGIKPESLKEIQDRWYPDA